MTGAVAPPTAAPPADRRVALAVARDLARRGVTREAAARYREILSVHPHDPEARHGLAQALVALGEFPPAVPLLDGLLHDNPQDLDAWRTRASAYRHLGDPAELLRCVEAILALDPADRAARLEEYHLHELSGDLEGAYRALAEVTDGGASPADAEPLSGLLLAQGDLAERLGRASEAEGAYDRAIAHEPSARAAVAVRRARTAWSGGRPDLALERLQDAMTNEAGTEGPVDALELRAELLLAVERPADAQRVYDALHARDPTSGAALIGAARSRIDQGHHPEARELLHAGRTRVARDEKLVLALAEAESGSGDLTAAEREVRDGVEEFPQSRDLWTRLAELAVARSDWSTAEAAYARALEIDPAYVDAALGGAFVAEKASDLERALSAYDRAAGIAPEDVRIWNRRGTLLLSVHRPAEAVESFDRALALVPESDIARDGRRIAERERRAATIEVHALVALRAERDLGRPITKNDLFVTLHVPFDLLDPVLAAIGRETKVDVATLPPADLERLEARSCALISAAFSRDGRVVESGELSLADVAWLSPPTATLADVQRLFAYVDSVLRMDLRPENLHLTSEMEETARRALALPIAQRSLFGLVRTLQIGLFRARVVKAVERASGTTRTPLPSVDLTPHAPELAAANPGADGTHYFSPENVPAQSPLEPVSASNSAGGRRAPRGWPAGVPLLGTQRMEARVNANERCVGCGGLATLRHGCGGALCRLCAHQFGNCPKCGAPIGALAGATHKSRTPGGPHATAYSAPAAPRPAPRAVPPAVREPKGPPTYVSKAAPEAASEPPRAKPARSVARIPATDAAPAAKGKESATPPPAPPATPPPKPRREKVDDEPRL